MTAMNEIKNYTMNFSFGRSLRSLDLLHKSACTETHGGTLVERPSNFGWLAL